MSDDAALEAFRLADSFLPVGTNSVSYGLEQFVADDRVADADDVEALLATHLRRLFGPGELVALRAAHASALDEDLEGVCEADRRLAAVTLPAEFRESAAHAGARLLDVQREVRDDAFLAAYAERVPGEAPGFHAVVLGATAARADISEREACLVCCHGFVTGLLGAAQRLLSLGHSDVQRVLADLQSTIADAVEDSADRSLAELTPFAPLVDVLAADHERADRRLFLS
ncbi:urease accessory protein UreF [Halobacterium sp. DL1]|nr:urease accessory protein UreF [Halobacterium sp. DL1]